MSRVPARLQRLHRRLQRAGLRAIVPAVLIAATARSATLTAATLLLAAATFAAGWLPAQRAARVDPLVALQAE